MKLQHWRALQAEMARKTAPVLEFSIKSYLTGLRNVPKCAGNAPALRSAK